MNQNTVNENSSSYSQEKKDCPRWAVEQIGQLRQIEVFLGNIPATEDWKSDHLTKISAQRLSVEYPGLNDNTAAMLFRRIVLGLEKEGFSTAWIARMINARCGYSGGPTYCDEKEVTEALALT